MRQPVPPKQGSRPRRAASSIARASGAPRPQPTGASTLNRHVKGHKRHIAADVCARPLAMLVSPGCVQDGDGAAAPTHAAAECSPTIEPTAVDGVHVGAVIHAARAAMGIAFELTRRSEQVNGLDGPPSRSTTSNIRLATRMRTRTPNPSPVVPRQARRLRAPLYPCCVLLDRRCVLRWLGGSLDEGAARGQRLRGRAMPPLGAAQGGQLPDMPAATARSGTRTLATGALPCFQCERAQHGLVEMRCRRSCHRDVGRAARGPTAGR